MQPRIRKHFFLFCFFLFTFPPIIFAEESFEKTVIVIVAEKDNLINICETWLENPHDWKTVAKFNHLENPHLIYPGKHLKLPAKLLKGVPMKGTVTFLKGQVTAVLPGGQDRVSLKKGDIVNQGSEIETGNDSAAEITFEDGSSFFLKPGTRISIRTARQREPYYMIRKLFVPAGRTLMKIKKSTGQDSRFEIYTPSSISAARGTRFRVSVDTEDVTRTEVLDGVVGVKGRGKEVVLDPGEGTWVKKGSIPVAPEPLLLPPALKDFKRLYQTLPVQFGLAPVEKAVSYRVILAKDPDMKDVVKESVVKQGNPVPKVMLPDGKYYCRVLSINKAGLEGIPSQAVPFEIRINPLPPFIQNPLDGRELKTDTVELEWLKVGDASSYQVQVSRHPDFKNLYKAFKNIKSNRESLEMDGYGDYYFRACSIAADGFKGLWSDGIRVSFVEPPKAPSADVPTMDEASISLRWQDFGPGMTYQFQMATDPLFKKILIDQNTDQAHITFDKPEDGGIYHVRVKALDPDGYEGEFSPAQTFEIEKFPYLKAGVIGTWLLGLLLIIL